MSKFFIYFDMTFSRATLRATAGLVFALSFGLFFVPTFAQDSAEISEETAAEAVVCNTDQDPLLALFVNFPENPQSQEECFSAITGSFAQ